MDVTNNAKERYAELDWLRVILIIAVFIHHVLMPFNGDDWHIMNTDSSKLLDDIMVYFEQLRLPVLFLIAGAGSLLMLNKQPSTRFINSKVKRLLVPLLLAMIVVIPPQSYFEAPEQFTSLWDAYHQRMWQFDNKHLWFIEFLIIFMLLAVPVRGLIVAQSAQPYLDYIEGLLQRRAALMLMGGVVVAVRCSLKLVYPGQTGSIENLSVSVFYFLFFVSGMLFISRAAIWYALRRYRRLHLNCFIVSSLLFYIYYLGDFSAIGSLTLRWQIWWALCTLVSWSGMLTMLGYAGQYLQTSPALLRQTIELIYPFYILHQTIIVALAFYIVQWNAGIPAKATSLLLLSLLATCSICYALIRPFNILRLSFGLKPQQRR